MDSESVDPEKLRSTILFVENGAFGGGSAESLGQIVKGLDQGRFAALVLFTSPIPAIGKIASIGVQTYLYRHWYVGRTDEVFAAVAARTASFLVNYGARIAPRICNRLEHALTKKLRLKVAALIRAHAVTIVHTNNNPHRDLWVIEAAAEAGVPCVSHLRSFHDFGFTKERASIANKHVEVFIAYSRSIAEHWIRAGLAANRVRVIHNAIGEVRHTSIDLASIVGESIAGPNIGLIGRVIPERGHDQLLSAIPELKQEFPNIRVLIIGGGDEAQIRRLVQRTTTMKIDDVVVFTGHRSDAVDILSALNAIVLPYKIEPFGRTLLEAWQLGVPVVLSRVGHITDVISDGNDAMLFDPAVSGDLARHLGAVLRDSELRSRLIANGRRTCAERFSIAAHCRQIEEIYSRILNDDQTSDSKDTTTL